jgi:hypothetical protein
VLRLHGRAVHTDASSAGVEPMDASYRIALWVRLYRLLSERPEYLIADAGERIERLIDARLAMSEYDRQLVMGAGELDRLCGHAVRKLGKHAPGAVLDVLGVLDPDRLLAMYHALPNGRRASVRRDPAWSYHIDHAPTGLEAAIAEVVALATESQDSVEDRKRAAAMAPPDVRKRTERHERVAMRLSVGLPILLTPREQEIWDQVQAGTRP